MGAGWFLPSVSAFAGFRRKAPVRLRRSKRAPWAAGGAAAGELPRAQRRDFRGARDSMGRRARFLGPEVVAPLVGFRHSKKELAEGRYSLRFCSPCWFVQGVFDLAAENVFSPMGLKQIVRNAGIVNSRRR